MDTLRNNKGRHFVNPKLSPTMTFHTGDALTEKVFFLYRTSFTVFQVNGGQDGYLGSIMDFSVSCRYITWF